MTIYRIATKIWKVEALLIAAALTVGTPATADNVKSLSGKAISPTAADNYYSPLGSGHTNQLCLLNSVMCSAPRAVAIRELARTLSRAGALSADQFTLNVYEYIYKNVDTEFRYGLSKGAFGALLDQSGTPFDQDHLMVELLREGAADYPANYSALSPSYQAGTVTLAGSMFLSWTGISSAAVACQFLANGGIPAKVNGSTPVDCSTLTGNVSSVVVSHIWVSANGKLYDPSYKTYIQKTPIDLNGAMGCGAGSNPCGAAAVAAAIPAGTNYQGFDQNVGANYVKNLQYGAMGTTLNNFAKNLQHHIESTAPTAQATDIAGGRTIDPSSMPTPALRFLTTRHRP